MISAKGHKKCQKVNRVNSVAVVAVPDSGADLPSSLANVCFGRGVTKYNVLFSIHLFNAISYIG